ncbi:MAG: DinB family protein [Chloroflexi bacterium]|nr:DinB family protein [Chloroflexota bacterium]
MSHVAELPGCFAVGSDAARAAGATPRAIADFLAWLKAHKEPLVPEAHVARPSMADILVADVRSEGAPTQAGGKAALFDFDTAAWDNDKLERTLRWLRYSRADLLAKIDGLDDMELKSRRLAPDRTLWATLLHIAHAEYGYINRSAGPLAGLSEPPLAGIREELSIVRAMLEDKARTVPAEERTKVVHPVWAARPDEPWTLQKALRRALEHEKEHLAELDSRR